MSTAQLEGLLHVAGQELKRLTAVACGHADLSERRGLSEHDLRVAEHLAARVARAQRALEALESVREQA